MVENTWFEMNILVIHTNNSESTKTFDYHLTCDKVRREIVPCQVYNYDDLCSYTLNVTEELQN